MSSPSKYYELDAPLPPLPPLPPKRKQIDDSDTIFEWPELTGLEELLLDSGQLPTHRTDHPCPPELSHIPDHVSDDLVHIINQSLEANQPSLSEETADSPSPFASDTSTTHTTEEHSLKSPQSPSDLVREHSKHSKVSRPSVSIAASDDGSSLAKRAREGSFAAAARFTTKVPKDLQSRNKERLKFRDCASCFDEIIDKNLVSLACQHKYCLTCFLGMVETAMENESKFPPKCCHEDIPLKLILHNLNHTRREAYKLKIHEYSISPANRWYCPSPRCGKWILPKKIKQGASTQKCPTCKYSICGSCRESAHPTGETCPSEVRSEPRVDSVASHGWRRCYRCKGMVDLTVESSNGYVVCKCGAEFCGFCGIRGGMCDCMMADQTSLQVEADMSEDKQREADELAATVAEIERLEHRDAQSRLHQEGIQKLREEEEQRIEEERRRQEEREAQEKELKRMIHIADQMRELRSKLAEVNRIQHSMVVAKHQDKAQSIQMSATAKQEVYEQKRLRLETALSSNISLRKTALRAEQSTQLLELLTHQEEEEDDNFIHMQRYLKGKPNREEREKAIVDKLKAAQRKDQSALEKAHKEVMDELEFHNSLESAALQTSIAKMLQDSQKDTNSKRYELSSFVISDRRWFNLVIERRNKLLEQHRLVLVSESRRSNSTARRSRDSDNTSKSSSLAQPAKGQTRSPNLAELSADIESV